MCMELRGLTWYVDHFRIYFRREKETSTSNGALRINRPRYHVVGQVRHGSDRFMLIAD